MSKTANKSASSAGRPRSESLDALIIRSATRLIQSMPYNEVTIEAIASDAGVGKASIYRRWPNKSALTVEVLLQQAAMHQLAYGEETFRAHLIRGIKGLRLMLSGVFAEAIVAIIAETQRNRELRELFYNAFLSRMQAIGDADLDIAIARGEVRPGIDKEMVFDQLFATAYYRLLILQKPMDDNYVERIVDNVLRQIRT